MDDIYLYHEHYDILDVKHESDNNLINNLPEDCIKRILNFYNTVNIFHINKCWFNIKKYIYIYELNHKHSNLYSEGNFSPPIKYVGTTFRNSSINKFINFKNIYKCHLTRCHNITNIDELISCRTLKLTQCKNVKQISINTLYTLTIVECNVQLIKCHNLKQLSIKINMEDVTLLTPNIYKLILYKCQQVDFTRSTNIESLYIRNSPNIYDWSNCINIKNLRLCNLDYYPSMKYINLTCLSLTNCREHMNISSNTIKTIELRICPNMNIDQCMNVERVILSNCPQIYDFSRFNNLSSLYIFGNLGGPINLKNNKDLKKLSINIYNYYEPIPISHLQKLTILNIDIDTIYRNLTDDCYTLPYLKKLQRIFVRGYKCVNVQNLKHVKFVEIYDAQILKQLHKINMAKSLDLSISSYNTTTKYTLDLNTIPKNILHLNLSNRVTSKYLDIKNLISLDISNNQQIYKLNHLKNLKKLNISKCGKYMIDLSELVNLESLNISNTYHKYNLSKLINLQFLNMSDTTFNYHDDINYLVNLKYIDMSKCYNMTNLNNLSHVSKIYLSHCDGITDVSPLKHVDSVFMDYCRNVKHISMLKNKCRLSIRGCPNIVDREELNILGELYE